MRILSITELQDYLNLLHSMPKVEMQELPTFMQISGYPNHENVISNLYQFFFLPDKHGFGTLFLEALNKLVDIKDLAFDNYTVSREVGTYKNGRIDLLIQEESADNNKSSRAIVIENKVYHHLDNDLDDYFESINALDVTCVVLALKHEKVKEPYVSITHQELMDSVKSLIGERFTSANQKYLVLLQDFIKHMDNYYTTNKDYMEAYEFIFKEGEKIEEMNSIQDEVFDSLGTDINKQLVDTQWQWKASNGWSFTLHKHDNSLVMYVKLEDLFSRKKFALELWIRGEKIVKKWWQGVYSRKFENAVEKYRIELKDKKDNKSWGLIGSKTYTITSAKELLNFGTIVKDYLNEEWEVISESVHNDFG